MTSEEYRRQTVRVCHKKGRIVEVNEQSYTVAIELGGVDQHIVVSEEFAEEQVDL